jgi:tetratricopeptide (TPR) repeat protein
VIKLSPELAGSHHALIGDCYAQEGRFPEAVAEWQQSVALDGDTRLTARLEDAYKRSGYSGYLHAQIDQMKATARTNTVSPLELASTYALLGDKDHTLEWLEKAYEDHDPWLYLKADPRFDSLRSDARFQSLIRQTGLPP